MVIVVYALSFVLLLALLALVTPVSLWGRTSSLRRRRYFVIGLTVTAVLLAANLVLGPHAFLSVFVYVSAALTFVGSSMLAGYQDDRDEALSAH